MRPSRTGRRSADRVAEATTSLRIGARVFCIDYRPLAVLVKEAATIDWLSDGRLEFGLGAGWLANEYEALGIPMDPAGVRVTRLGEYVRAAKALLAGDDVDIDGEHVSLHGFAGAPARTQATFWSIFSAVDDWTPSAPILPDELSKLRLTMSASSPARVRTRRDPPPIMIGGAGVRAGAESAGRDLPEIEIAGYFTVVTPDVATAAKTAAGFGQMFGLDAQDIIDHPNCLIGTLDQIVDRLVERRERYGISYVTVGDSNMDAFAPVVDRLAGT